MKAQTLINNIENLGIEDYIGVPDSTLKPFCDYLNIHKQRDHHFVPVNEGAAVALASGLYLGNQTISCVYMQNSGIGNAVNPIASLIHELVYDIPMLFVIGYRGEPGQKDEPQHKFQGAITLPLLTCMQIEHACIDKETTDKEVSEIFETVKQALLRNKQFAIVVKKDTFDKGENFLFDNTHSLSREEAIKHILLQTKQQDVLISTTGKISREVYEQCNALFGNHDRAFLTVGSMGHATMIALGVALRNKNRTVYCIDGDGASLMHMGSMAFLAQQNCSNLIHITLNNQAHESVGGMPTNCQNISFKDVAKSCGYTHTYLCSSTASLLETMQTCTKQDGPIYIEVLVSLGARADLGRPKESAIENKNSFMKHIEKWRD